MKDGRFIEESPLTIVTRIGYPPYRTASMMISWIRTLCDLRVKIDRNRLSEPVKSAAVKVKQKLSIRKSHGIPPKMRTIASRGKLTASKSMTSKSLLSIFPMTI